MRITIDRDVCIGSGNCVRIAEDIFDQDDEAIVTLLNASPPDDRTSDVLHAIDMCPTRAIALDAD